MSQLYVLALTSQKYPSLTVDGRRIEFIEVGNVVAAIERRAAPPPVSEIELRSQHDAVSAMFSQADALLPVRFGAWIDEPELSNVVLRQQEKIRKQFASLLGGKPEQYWELVEIEEKGVLSLGASYSRATSGGGFQAADVLYYASGGYYAGVTLYQMWPVTVDGKPSTLVWRGDLISSPELAGLRGVERLGSESSMIKDVSKSIRAFRRDTGGSR